MASFCATTLIGGIGSSLNREPPGPLPAFPLENKVWREEANHLPGISTLKEQLEANRIKWTSEFPLSLFLFLCRLENLINQASRSVPTTTTPKNINNSKDSNKTTFLSRQIPFFIVNQISFFTQVPLSFWKACHWSHLCCVWMEGDLISQIWAMRILFEGRGEYIW